MFDFRIHETLKTKTDYLTFNEQLNLRKNTCPQPFFVAFPHKGRGRLLKSQTKFASYKKCN